MLHIYKVMLIPPVCEEKQFSHACGKGSKNFIEFIYRSFTFAFNEVFIILLCKYLNMRLLTNADSSRF